MPGEQGETGADQEATETPLHAHGGGREEDVEGEMGEDFQEDADDVENTGGATSGGPGGEAHGEEDPSDV